LDCHGTTADIFTSGVVVKMDMKSARVASAQKRICDP